MGLSTYWCVWWLCWWSVLFHWAEYRWVCRQTDGLVVGCAKYRWDCGCTILLTANGDDHVVECRDCCRHTDWLWCHRGCSEYKINGVVHHVGSGHQLLVEFNAHKEKLMKEKITLRSATSDEVLFLIFHARVLGEWSELYAVSCTPDANACIPSCTHYKIYWFTQVRTHTHTQHTHKPGAYNYEGSSFCDVCPAIRKLNMPQLKLVWGETLNLTLLICTQLYWHHEPCGHLRWLKMWCHKLCTWIDWIPKLSNAIWASGA